ncbi:hypothetical protein ACFQX4_17715 [Roseomonas sp. GCM10028921]
MALVNFGALKLLDGFFHIQVSRFLPVPAFERTLLLRLEGEQVKSDEAALVRALSRLGARQVLFPFGYGSPLPSTDGTSVISGRHAQPDRLGGADAGWVLAEPPVGSPTAWGVLIRPPLDAGVLRRMPTTVMVDGTPVPTLPYAAAQQAAAPTTLVSGEAFFPRFPRDPASLPSVDAQRVLEGRVPAELVANRSVVIAPPPDPRLPGFATPPNPDAATLPMPELQAVALDDLLSGRTVRELGPGASLLVILAASLAGLLVYKRISPRKSPWVALAVTAAILLAYYGSLRFADLLLPVSALMLSQGLLSLVIWRWREVAEEHVLTRMRRELSARLRKVAVSTSDERLQVGTDVWQAAAAMISRLLGIRRSLFLLPCQSPSGTPSLEQAAGVGANLADLPLDRRNPSLPPFSVAMQEGRAIPMERSFLAPAEAGEDVYLASVHSSPGAGGTSLFWVFTLPEGETQRVPALLEAIRGAAAVLEVPAGDSATFGTGAKRLDDALWRDVDALMRRATTLAGVLNEISTAAVIFDPLGRILHMNARMEAAAAMTLPAGADVAPLDLVAALSGLSHDHAARLVRRVLLERTAVELNAARPLGGRYYLLRLAALGGEEDGQAVASALLCEAVDVTEPLRLAEVQRGFTEHVGLRLRNQAEAVQLGIGLINDSRLPEPARVGVMARLRDAADAIGTTVTTAESFMTFEVGGPAFRTYPVDALAALRSAAAAASAEAARRRGVRIDLVTPEIAGLALASPAGLDAALGAILLLLVGDTRDGGAVSVTLEQSSTSMLITSVNDGFGMPEARLEAVLSGQEPPGSPELGNLREAVRAAASWGGQLKAEASPGQGFRLSLTLKILF